MFRRLFPLVVIALLGACASAPIYAPAASPAAAGYSERQIESSRYFVTYRAAGQADVEVLQDFALLRAAELTLQNGRDWFWLDRRTLDEEGGPQNGPSIGIGIGSGSYGRRSGVNVGVGINIPIGAPADAKARAATAEIRFGEGVRPDDANAYDAHALVANLRARLLSPR